MKFTIFAIVVVVLFGLQLPAVASDCTNKCMETFSICAGAATAGVTVCHVLNNGRYQECVQRADFKYQMCLQPPSNPSGCGAQHAQDLQFCGQDKSIADQGCDYAFYIAMGGCGANMGFCITNCDQ